MELKEPELIGIYEFQEGIKQGLYTDRKGKAEIIINGAAHNTYTVHIDRKIVSSAGSLVSFTGLLKEYGADNIKIKYIEKAIKLPDLQDYIAFKQEQTQRKNKKKQ